MLTPELIVDSIIEACGGEEEERETLERELESIANRSISSPGRSYTASVCGGCGCGCHDRCMSSGQLSIARLRAGVVLGLMRILIVEDRPRSTGAAAGRAEGVRLDVRLRRRRLALEVGTVLLQKPSAIRSSIIPFDCNQEWFAVSSGGRERFG